MSRSQRAVSQFCLVHFPQPGARSAIHNLPYRRIASCTASAGPGALGLPTRCRCKSAIQQIQICATPRSLWFMVPMHAEPEGFHEPTHQARAARPRDCRLFEGAGEPPALSRAGSRSQYMRKRKEAFHKPTLPNSFGLLLTFLLLGSVTTGEERWVTRRFVQRQLGCQPPGCTGNPPRRKVRLLGSWPS